MDESPLSPDAVRPTQGGSYVRMPDGSVIPEAEWLAAQAEAGQAEAAPPGGAAPVQAPSRRRSLEKEG